LAEVVHGHGRVQKAVRDGMEGEVLCRPSEAVPAHETETDPVDMFTGDEVCGDGPKVRPAKTNAPFGIAAPAYTTKPGPKPWSLAGLRYEEPSRTAPAEETWYAFDAYVELAWEL